MKGYAQRRLDRDGWEILLLDESRNRCFTMEFREHTFVESMNNEVTFVARKDIYLLHAISEALVEMGILDGSATEAELKATKFHLEDMRTLVFEEKA